MTRSPGDLENPSTEIKLYYLIEPVREAEEVRDARAVGADHGRLRTAFELGVAAEVVTVPVSVRNHQGVWRPGMCGQPGPDQAINRFAHRTSGRVAGRAGIEQKSSVVTEEQVEEGSLIADRLALTQDERVVVIAMRLDLRLAVAAARPDSVVPPHIEGSR